MNRTAKIEKKREACVKPSILLICVYLGKPPRWTDAYLKSCEKNPGVNWLLLVDWEHLPETPPNVRIKRVTKESIEMLIMEKTGIRVTIHRPYKICDYKLLYGNIFDEEIRGYDFWGFTDLDIIYGNIRNFITDEMLQKYDIITGCKYHTVGHFTIIRNGKRFNDIYKKNSYYKEIIQDEHNMAFDELGLTEILKRKALKKRFRWYHENIIAHSIDANWFSSMANKITNEERRDYDYKNSANWDRSKGGELEPCIHGPCIWDNGTLRHIDTGKEVMYLHFSYWQDMDKPLIKTDRWLIRKEGILGLTGDKETDEQMMASQLKMYKIIKIRVALDSVLIFGDRMIGKAGIIMRKILSRMPDLKVYSAIYNYLRHGLLTPYMFSVVEFEINSMCNRKCVYCPNNKHERKQKGFMKEELFRKCVDDLSRINYSGLINYSFYGEPLLDRRLEKFVEYAGRKCPHAKSIIFTNGDFLNPGRFRRLLRLGIEHFIVTQHDNKLNSGMKKILAGLEPVDRKKILLQFPENMFLLNRAGAVTSVKKSRGCSKDKCSRPSFNMVITLNGNVLPCCNDYFEKEVMGNTHESSLAEIWNSRKFREFRSDLLKGRRNKYGLCRHCDWWAEEDLMSYLDNTSSSGSIISE